MKPSVYIETSVVSYYTSRTSRDLIVAARQQLTHDWWKNYRNEVEIYISTLVIEESEAGDIDAAKRRLDAISDFPVLELNDQTLNLAISLTEQGPINDNFFEDALHIAVAA